MTDAWILTYTGRQFWPLAPRVEDVCIEDIAHALSNLCRFGGHVQTFYSVAQHSVLASRLTHPKYALQALLHDASEAYLCDLPSPIKRRMPLYQEAEERIMAVIEQTYHLDVQERGGVKMIDEQLLLTERRDLMAPGHWLIDERKCLKTKIRPWSARASERAFLQQFREVSV